LEGLAVGDNARRNKRNNNRKRRNGRVQLGVVEDGDVFLTPNIANHENTLVVDLCKSVAGVPFMGSKELTLQN
jgi:hypothetical protein